MYDVLRRLTDEELDQSHRVLEPARRRLAEERWNGEFSEARWNEIHINHVIALLSDGNYGGARLQAGLIRTPELRRDWIDCIDARRIAGPAMELDDEVFAVAAD